jgi:hypothetical protein
MRPAVTRRALGDGNAVSVPVYRSADLNHKLQDGKLKKHPKQHCQNDRRTQRAKQAAFQFRRLALRLGLIFEIGGNIRHDTFLTIACVVSASDL